MAEVRERLHDRVRTFSLAFHVGQSLKALDESIRILNYTSDDRCGCGGGVLCHEHTLQLGYLLDAKFKLLAVRKRLGR